MHPNMLATLLIILYFVDDSFTPLGMKEIPYITCDGVEKIMQPTRGKEGYPISGRDVVP